MDSVTYKCPNCDGGLEFDPETQKFKCGYCLSEFVEAELKKQEQEPEPSPGPDIEGQESPVVVYSCPSCGAEIITEETTASTFCYYCHNPVVLSGKLDGVFRPDCVLPFEMDKKKATEIFKGWISRKKYVPKDFYSPKQIELLEGIYYPYWLYDCEIDGKITADATKLNVNRMGAIEYTETSRFKVERAGTMKVENITRNALKKADHRLSEGVLPFDMEKQRPFQGGYLSGFKAERRDLDKDVYEEEIRREIEDFAVAQLKGSIGGYQTVSVSDHEEKLLSSKWKYALMPVWVLTYRDDKSDKLYYFAMNGQSGKICGVLPVDYKRLAGLFSMIFIPLFILFLIGGYFI